MSGTHLLRRDGRYYFRRRIPRDLRCWFSGRGEIRISLRTTSLASARSLVKLQSFRAEKVFTLIRSGTMTAEQIRQLVNEYVEQTLNDAEEARVQGCYLPTDRGDLDEMMDTHSLLLEEATEALAMGNTRQVEHVALDLIREKSLKQPERYWIPLIGVFSGMRLNEICQLYVEDVREEDGVLCIDINDRGDKKLKNASSRRIIPVHPVLVELRFGEYVEGLRREGATRLWRNLNRKRDGYGQDFSKWYQRMNRKYITKESKKVFHSFRHTVADTLKQAQVDETVIKEILGHSQGSITLGRYGKAYNPRTMLDALQKLAYDIDLKSLSKLSG